MKQKWLTTKNLVLMGMFGALAGVLMMFEFPLAFIAPTFYGLDLSEVPVLVGAFSMGPMAGVIIEFVKILVKLMMKPTSTGFVGEMANFVIGCSLVLPAAMIYHTKKSKKSAMYGMIIGTIFMALSGIVINAVVMLPFYSKVMPLGAFWHSVRRSIRLSAISGVLRLSVLVRSTWLKVLQCLL